MALAFMIAASAPAEAVQGREARFLLPTGGSLLKTALQALASACQKGPCLSLSLEISRCPTRRVDKLSPPEGYKFAIRDSADLIGWIFDVILLAHCAAPFLRGCSTRLS
jgi:hypothetical protein